MEHKRIRYTIVGLATLLGIMAIYGGISLLVDAQGFGMKEAWLNGSPFTDYQIPALGLLIGVAGSSLLAAVAVLRARPIIGDVLSFGAGVILMVFEIVETYSIGMRNFQQPLMFVFGLAMAALATYLWLEDRPHKVERGRFTYAH